MAYKFYILGLKLEVITLCCYNWDLTRFLSLTCGHIRGGEDRKIMASGPITSWQIDGETLEKVADFIFGGGSKITADGDCSHEIKRRLLLGRKVMTNLDSLLKSRDITLPTEVRLVKAMVFPVVMYGCAAAVAAGKVTSVMSNSVLPHRRQTTRLCCPWDSPGKNTGVGCNFLLQCMKVKMCKWSRSVVSNS